MSDIAAIRYERVAHRADDTARPSSDRVNTKNSQIIVDGGNTGSYGGNSSGFSEHNVEPSIEIDLSAYVAV